MSDYLIWSNEHGAWWGPDRCGYVARTADAGRYSPRQALQICTDAIPGRAPDGPLPEIPVRLVDIEMMLELFGTSYPGHDPEPAR